jgi:hypothetical protein
MSVASRTDDGPFTWADFVVLGDEDHRELIDRELVEVEVTTLRHEHVVARRLTYSPKRYLIAEACEGEAVFEPASFPGLAIPLAKAWLARPATPTLKKKSAVKKATPRRRPARKHA